ncbi:MAG: DUF11 domain-containing protein [bacterium]|nr:DUF11 domain-containing protein [bacterium]
MSGINCIVCGTGKRWGSAPVTAAILLAMLGVLAPGAAMAQTDLGIVKTSTPESVVAGEELIYDVTVTNNGPSTALDVVVADTFPPEVTYLSDTGGGSYDGSVLTCDVGDIAPGENRTFQIKMLVAAGVVAEDADGSMTINNTAEVTSATADPFLANNTYTEATFVEEQADLIITKVSAPVTHVQAGEEFTYTVYVENLGPSYARRVSFRDEILSSGAYTLVSTTLDPNRDEQGPFVQATPAGGTTLEVDLIEPLEPVDIFNGGRWVVQITVRANETQDINNLVQVFPRTGGTPDPYLLNNACQNFISVEAVADLVLTKAAVGEVLAPDMTGTAFDPMAPGVPFPEGPEYVTSLAQVTAGRRIEYTLTVTNDGPSTAVNVLVRDGLPAGVMLYPTSIVLSQGSLWAGTPGNPLDPMSWAVGPLAPFGDAVLTFQVIVSENVPAETVLVNNSQAMSETLDLDTGNNFASTLTLVAEESSVDPPASPTNLQATEGLVFQAIRLTWDAAPEADVYEVYRSPGSSFATAELVASVYTTYCLDYPPSLSQPFSTGCDYSTNMVYTYWVVAVNGLGSSLPSEPARGYTGRSFPKSQSAAMVPAWQGFGEFAVLAFVFLFAMVASRRWTRRAKQQ